MSEVSKLGCTLLMGHLGAHHKPFWVSIGAVIWMIGMTIVGVSESVPVMGFGFFVYGAGYATTLVLTPPILDESVKKVGFVPPEEDTEATNKGASTSDGTDRDEESEPVASKANEREAITTTTIVLEDTQLESSTSGEADAAATNNDNAVPEDADDPTDFSPLDEETSRDPHRANFFVGVVMALSVLGVIASFLVCAFATGHWQTQYLVTGFCAIFPAVILFLVGAKMYKRLASAEGIKKVITDAHRPPFLQTMFLIGIKNRVILLLTINMSFSFFISAAVTSFLPKFIETELKQSKKSAALIMAATIPAIVSSIFVGGLVARKAKLELNGCLVALVICQALLIPLLIIAFGVEMPLGLFVVMEVIAMMFAFFPTALVFGALAHAVHHSKIHESYANGFFNFFSRIVGTVCGPIAAGALLDSGMNIRHVFILVGVISLALAVLTGIIAVWYNRKYGIPPLSEYFPSFEEEQQTPEQGQQHEAEPSVDVSAQPQQTTQ